jgi:hypothetical protein
MITSGESSNEKTEDRQLKALCDWYSVGAVVRRFTTITTGSEKASEMLAPLAQYVARFVTTSMTHIQEYLNRKRDGVAEFKHIQASNNQPPSHITSKLTVIMCFPLF